MTVKWAGRVGLAMTVAVLAGCGGSDSDEETSAAGTETTAAQVSPEETPPTTLPEQGSGAARAAQESGQTLREVDGPTRFSSLTEMDNCFGSQEPAAVEVDPEAVQAKRTDAAEGKALSILPLDVDRETNTTDDDGATDLTVALREIAGKTGSRGQRGVLAQEYADTEAAAGDTTGMLSETGGYVAIRNVSTATAQKWSAAMQENEDSEYAPRWLFGGDGGVFVAGEVVTPEPWIEACFSE